MGYLSQPSGGPRKLQARLGQRKPPCFFEPTGESERRGIFSTGFPRSCLFRAYKSQIINQLLLFSGSERLLEKNIPGKGLWTGFTFCWRDVTSSFHDDLKVEIVKRGELSQELRGGFSDLVVFELTQVSIGNPGSRLHFPEGEFLQFAGRL